MKNKNYSIFGRILSIINNDYPPYVSKNFSDNVMKNIHTNGYSKTSKFKTPLNIAASLFFAMITTYALISLEPIEKNTVAQEIIEKDNDLIKRVIDDSSCKELHNKEGNPDNECK